MSKKEIEGIRAKLRWEHLPEHKREELELRLQILVSATNNPPSEDSANE